MKSFIPKSLYLLKDSSNRSVKLNKNIILSFVCKSSSIITGLLMVRLCLNYLGQEKYGIWLTISSVIGWFSFFEIGLGTGLRNKLAEALAVNDLAKGKALVSTTYALLSGIVLILSVIFFILNKVIDWTKILNTDYALFDELNCLVILVFNLFLLRIVLKLISIILYSDQRPALASSIEPITNFLSFLLIFLLTKTTDDSLLLLGFALSVVPVFVLLVFSYYFFRNEYKNISPSIRAINYRFTGDLFNLGIKFFFIQISGIILYQTSTIIVAHCFGVADVASYSIAYKLFSLINMVFAIIAMPFWSACTEAWTLNDIDWIKNSISSLLKIWALIFMIGIIILFFSQDIYRIWVGKSLEITFLLSSLLLIYFALYTFGAVYNFFINGIGKIKLQLYSSIIGAFLFFPLSYFFIKIIGTGIEGLILAIIISNFYGPLLAPIQFYKIINKKDKGIWAQ